MPTPHPPAVEHPWIAAADDALRAQSWDEAKALFDRMLADPDDGGAFLHPIARVGLAGMQRLRGEPYTAFEQLQLAAAGLPPADAGPPAARAAWRRLLAESSRCHLALGLADLAARDAERLDALIGDAGPVDRFEAARMAIDLRLLRMEWVLARRRAEQAVADREILARVADAAVELDMRRLIAALRIASVADGLPMAAELEALIGRVSPPARTRTALQVAGAWLQFGQPDKARRRAEWVLAQQDPRPTLVEEGEAEALVARAAMAQHATVAELGRLRGRVAAVFERMRAAFLAAPNRAGGSGPFQFGGRRDVLATLLRLDKVLLSGEEAHAAAWQHVEAALTVGTVARAMAVSAASLAEIRERLVPADGGVLAWTQAPSGGHLLAVDRDGCVHEEYAVDEAFTRTHESVRVALLNQPTDAAAGMASLRASAEVLAQRYLPASLAERLRTWRRIVLIGDDLQGVVWHVLPFEGDWLCLQRAIVHAPSASLLLHLQADADRRLQRGSAPNVALLADPQPAAAALRRWALPALDLDATQRSWLTESLPRGAVHARWGSEATDVALIETAGTAVNVVCVLAHGVQDTARERFAGLMLAPAGASDGLVFADDLERTVDVASERPLPLLAILGACSASAGPTRRGDDGASHLGGAMLIGGCRGVVLASGDLPLAATTELFGALLREVAAGTGTAEALRLARRRLAAQPGREHPWYYAGLRLVGADVRFASRR